MRRLGQGDIAVFGCLNDLVIPEILNYFGRQMGQVKGSALRIRGAEDRTFGSSPRTSVEEFENDQFLAMKTENKGEFLEDSPLLQAYGQGVYQIGEV